MMMKMMIGPTHFHRSVSKLHMIWFFCHPGVVEHIEDSLK